MLIQTSGSIETTKVSAGSLTPLTPKVADLCGTAIFLSGHNPDAHVALIAGGGAGHEPAHAAFVGENLLTAAVSGSIFASPSVRQIVNTIARVGGKAGTILSTSLLLEAIILGIMVLLTPILWRYSHQELYRRCLSLPSRR